MNKKIFIILLIAIIVIIGVFYFLQQKNKQSSPQSEGADADLNINNITIENFSFNPAELNIKKGDTVTWINQDSAPHSISGGDFKSNMLNKGQSFSFTFDNTGILDYICGIHTYMKGKIVVQ